MRRASPVDMHQVQRVAIVKLTSIGDVVHALPVSAALKRTFPHLQLTWIVEERCAEMVTGNPYLHEVIPVPGKAWRHGAWHPRTWQDVRRLLNTLRSRHFQLTLDLQGLLKSAVVAWLTGAPLRIGYHWQREGAWLFNRVVPKEPTSVHAVQEYLDVARFLGAETEPVEFPLYIPPEADEKVLTLLKQEGISTPEGFLSINPSAGQPYKRWRMERWAEVISHIHRRYGLPVVLVGSRADRPLVQEIRRQTNAPFVDMVGRTNLKELAALLRRSAVHLCADTGSAHISVALGRPVIGLYGPTNHLRTSPYGQEHRLLTHKHECPICQAQPRREHSDCMDRITVTEVMQMLERTLSEVTSRV
ncbi:MAG: glycosyltransferase family 9 protein [Armatimonadota bacterium]|nr:glycosyltransferase family 9 protein [bacterium]MCS7309535.1 glycosyltransferase family 9 protein [Armatimonadota bacterium]MDW8289465.1 glycosyltransferase family 9 protein [Armatimonadota bacterium]